MATNLAVLVAAVLVGSVHSSPTVTIAQGSLVGHIYNTTYGAYYAFQGIPYAKPPVGELRFKPAVAPEPWTGVFQATQEGAVCTQPVTSQGTVIGEEDCLFINVYTPQLPDPSALLPVMVWLHGGGYYTGSGNLKDQGPGFLLHHGVLFVSLNYRLSALGFLSTQDEACPGNVGLKDQVMALKWIQKNIAAFGGDPNKVTVFGVSAGASSVSLHVLSSMSAGLFHAGIFQSGSAANPSSVRGKDRARNTAFHLGNSLGYTGNSSKELVNFLRTISADDLVAAASTDIPEDDKYRFSTVIYPPVVEPRVEGEEPFLSDNPRELLDQGKFNHVPLIIGVNSAEGLFPLGAKGVLDGSLPPEEISKNLTKMLKPDLRNCETDACAEEIVTKIKSFYFGDAQITSDNLEKLIDLVTDMIYTAGSLYTVEKMATHGNNPVYFYLFSYDGELSIKSGIKGAMNFSGVPHAGELNYIFDNGVEATNETCAFVRSTMATLWTNFAKTGNPTADELDDIPRWLPYTASSPYYLDIDAVPTLKTNFRKERMDFWKTLYESDSSASGGNMLSLQSHTFLSCVFLYYLRA